MSVHELAVAGFQKGSNFNLNRPPFTDEAVSFIAKLLADLKVTSEQDISYDVLELGAGTGLFTRKILSVLPKGTRYLATEPSEGFLKTLQQESPDVETRQCAANSIPLRDSSVKMLICANCFHWFAKKDAFDEINRVLIPGGTLVLIWNMRDMSVSWVEEVEDIVCSLQAEIPDIIPTKGKWRRVFAEYGGFKDEVHTRLPGTPLMADIDGIMKYYGTFSVIIALDEEPQQQVLSRIRSVVERGAPGEGYFPFKTEIFTYTCNK